MLLEAKSVTKSFRGRRGGGQVVAVREATLRAEPGQFVAIVGESGSGKSTLARLLLDLIPATGGSVELDGKDVSRLTRPERREYRRRVQAVLQDPAGSLNPRKRVEQTIGEVVRLHKIARGRDAIRQKVTEALELVGMEPAEQGRQLGIYAGSVAVRHQMLVSLIHEHDLASRCVVHELNAGADHRAVEKQSGKVKVKHETGSGDGG